MKKYISLFGALALIAASCSVDENKMARPGTEDGSRIVLSGTSTMNTKVSIGEKDGEVYPLLWATGDAIKVSTQGAALATEDNPAPAGTFSNENAELFSESAGRVSGVFQTTNALVADSDMKLVITYPGSAVYSEGILTSTVPALQTQRTASSSIHVGNYALAYDNDVDLAAGQTEDVTFELQQKTAFVKMVISSSEYSAYNLTGAKLYAVGAELAGDVACDLSTGELTATNTSESVGAVISRPSALSEPQEVYFTALPCDLSANGSVYAIITMENPAGNETVTIPVKIAGGELKESCLSVIEITGVSASSLPDEFKWYDPVETRDLVDGWAYGKQNTYFIEQKPKGEGGTTITIDVRARGDFSKVKEPVYYGILSHANVGNTRKLLYLPDGSEVYEATPTNLVKDDYTIDVSCYDQAQTGTWGVVALYDKDYNIIWSFMIWRYLTGDEPGDVTYPAGDIVLLDRLIGSDYSNSYAAELGKMGGAWAYFQWGRKDPFMWSNNGNSVYNQTYVTAGLDLEDVTKTPYLIYGAKDSDGDWQAAEHRPDLWGGVNNTTDWYDPNGIGHKTIYDPCPAGYRVCDARVFNEVKKSAIRWEFDNGMEHQSDEMVDQNQSPFTGDNTSVLAYPLGNDSNGNTMYDYWPYSGAHWGSNDQWGNRTGSNNRHGAIYWANSVNPTTTSRGVIMQYCYFSATFDMAAVDAVRSQAFAIRCQKDTENR